MSEKLIDMHLRLSNLIDEVKTLFLGRVHVSIIVRNFDYANSDVLTGDASVDDILEVLKLVKNSSALVVSGTAENNGRNSTK